jgi:drug/metabolite transporter (DMT)-like permease
MVSRAAAIFLLSTTTVTAFHAHLGAAVRVARPPNYIGVQEATVSHPQRAVAPRMCVAEQATLTTQEPVELEASTGGLSTNTARLILAGVAAVYGSNYPTVKLLDEWLVCVPAAAVLRFSLAVLLLIPVLLHAARDEPRVLHYPLARDGLEVGFLFGLGYMAQATALEASPAGLQAFLLSLTVIVCPVCESAFEGTRQPMRVWLAALLSAVGVAALEGGDVGGLGAGAIGLWQPVLFGVGFYRLECAMRRHCHPTEQVEVMAAEAEGMAAEGMAALPTLEAEFALTAACASSVDACTLERQAAAATRAAPIEPSTAALALTAWQMASVLAVAAAWLALDAGGPAAFAGSVYEAFGTSLTRPEVAAALLWTGTVTTAGCAYLEATAMARLSSSDAMVIFASEP